MIHPSARISAPRCFDSRLSLPLRHCAPPEPSDSPWCPGGTRTHCPRLLPHSLQNVPGTGGSQEHNVPILGEQTMGLRTQQGSWEVSECSGCKEPWNCVMVWVGRDLRNCLTPAPTTGCEVPWDGCLHLMSPEQLCNSVRASVGTVASKGEPGQGLGTPGASISGRASAPGPVPAHQWFPSPGRGFS